jgi:hypothetical protein
VNKVEWLTIIYLFLYFPEDKSEYIPAAITCTIFLIAAIFTMRWIIKLSKREQEKAEQFEKKLTKKTD